MTEQVTPGKTTIAPEVLLAIVRLETQKVPGVHALAPVPGAVNRFLRRSEPGVRLQVHDDVVDADIYVVLEGHTNIRRVSREVQKAVAQALERMVGMTPGRINVHIEDLYYPEAGDEGA